MGPEPCKQAGLKQSRRGSRELYLDKLFAWRTMHMKRPAPMSK